MGRKRAAMPRARTEELVTEELPEETLVYDLKRHKAHCLNRAAAVVWQHSDGRTSTTQMAKILSEESELPQDEGIVQLALNRLQKAKLMEEGTNIPAVAAGQSRRELVKRLALGGLAMLLPVVTSMVAPAAAMAASTVPSGDCKDFCTGLGLVCVGGKGDGKTCIVDAKKGGCKCK